MDAATKQHNWSKFLKLFSEQNCARQTRIGVFEGAPDAMQDYWIEDGLPLTGIDVDEHHPNAPTVEMMLGDRKDAKMRAERIAASTGDPIGNARSAKMGVMQITAVDSTEVSDAGIYDASSVEKDMTAVVNISFAVE